jgi:hypothetical protein
MSTLPETKPIITWFRLGVEGITAEGNILIYPLPAIDKEIGCHDLGESGRTYQEVIAILGTAS